MEEERAYRAHIVVFPFHGQGHVNPMLQFSKRLASKGLKITVTTILSNTKKMEAGDGSISFESIYDDSGEGGVAGGVGFQVFIERFEASCSRSLKELIQKLESSKNPVKCLVYDANMPWALDIAKELGLAGAAFFTQSCAAIASYYPMHKDLLGEPLWEEAAISLSGFPPLKLPNLPSLVSASGKYPPLVRFILKQFSNIEKADWVLFNSFHELEEGVLEWMSKLWSVRTIGPTVPSVYLDKRVEGDKDYGFSLFKPSSSDACIKWLNTKETGSVVYVAFGSNAILNAEQMEEIAWALREKGSNFLWVVKASEQNKLPIKFAEETSDKGLVTTWCPQLEVLAHRAVGCFVTHCGWNSTMEALSFGVPMVGLPQYLDQMTNSYLVEKVWGVGVKPRVDENGLASGEEIEGCIREVMSGASGEEMKRNATRWMELAKEAVAEGGTSDEYINEFIARLVSI